MRDADPSPRTPSRHAYRLPGPVQLAYLGDAVWELHVRSAVMKDGAGTPDDVHRRVVKRVHAAAQAQLLRRLQCHLTEGEREIVRRGRNAKSGLPRGIAVADYRHSTAFECLLGFLYFTGQHRRLQELMRIADDIAGRRDGIERAGGWPCEAERRHEKLDES